MNIIRKEKLNKNKGLTFVKVAYRKNTNVYNEYICNECKDKVIMAASNSKKCKTCGCSRYLKEGRPSSKNPIYCRYRTIILTYETRNKKLPFMWNTYYKFYNWCIQNGWSKDKLFLRKNVNELYSPNNCLFVNKDIGYKISCSTQNIMLNEKITNTIKTLYDIYKLKLCNESDLVIINFIALKLKLSATVVYKVINNINDLYFPTINKAEDRSAYKRAWRLVKCKNLSELHKQNGES